MKQEYLYHFFDVWHSQWLFWRRLGSLQGFRSPLTCNCPHLSKICLQICKNVLLWHTVIVFICVSAGHSWGEGGLQPALYRHGGGGTRQRQWCHPAGTRGDQGWHGYLLFISISPSHSLKRIHLQIYWKSSICLSWEHGLQWQFSRLWCKGPSTSTCHFLEVFHINWHTHATPVFTLGIFFFNYLRISAWADFIMRAVLGHTHTETQISHTSWHLLISFPLLRTRTRRETRWAPQRRRRRIRSARGGRRRSWSTWSWWRRRRGWSWRQ